MKKPFKNKYPAVVEVTMQTYYERLSERNRRQYAAIEAIKLDWGGRTYIGQLLNLSQKTLRKGIEEVQNPLEKADWPPNQQRKPGGGRKVFFLSSPNVLDLFESFLKEYKAGSPTDSNVYWISLTRSQIRRLFAEKHQIQLRSRSIRQMLGRLGYRYRSIQKELATGKCDEREAQFQFIFEMVAAQSLQTPILSIDCKKKELLGNLYREGKCDTIGHQKAYDHDFPNLGKGKIIPHGIYDLQHNQGFITIGNSSETAGFIVDNLRWWWSQFGRFQYPDAKQILILCDAGGGNSYRHHVFKKELQRFAREMGRDILICHYPPYASKWNPIEHRLFCHMHNAMSGQMFQDYETVQRLIQNTQTDAGLTVTVRIHLQKYEIGIKTPQSDVDPKRIEFPNESSKLSYKICA